jgi:hypothetical protein
MATVFRQPIYNKRAASKRIRGFVAPNLLITTLAAGVVAMPFHPVDWPNTVRAKVVLKQPQQPVNLLLTTLASPVADAPFVANAQIKLVKKAAQPRVQQSSNLLMTTLVTVETTAPFVPNTLFKPFKGSLKQPGQTPSNLLLTTLAQLPTGTPFAQQQWPVLSKRFYKPNGFIGNNLLETTLADDIPVIPPEDDTDRLSLAIREAYASAPSGVVVIHTLEFRHPNFIDQFGTPVAIRAVLGHDSLEAKLEADAPQNAGEYVIFIPMGFELELPNIEHIAVPEIVISIDNVSRELEDNLTLAAASPYPVEVTYRPYLNTDLTEPQMNPPLTMTLISAEADDFRVTARATYGNAANILCPREVYNTARFPGIQR